jgi:hypothetical protein
MKRIICSAILLLILSAPRLAWGCPVPVFQYALEFWEADPYYFTLYHRGALTAEEEKALGILEEFSRPGGAQANVHVETVDLAAPNSPSIPESVPVGTNGAWMVVHYPGSFGPGDQCWDGPLTVENARLWCESPLRREVAASLLARESAAWILLRSGNARKDRAAEARLRNELQRLEQTLVLPDLDSWAWGDPEETQLEPAEVRFSVFTLDRKDPEEKMLVHMLLGSEADLKKLAEEPMAFPVFGQGRALYALIGEGINDWTISKAAEFLTSPCSCQVKALNPGTDLLMAVDWEAGVEKRIAGAMPPPIGLAAFPDRIQEAEELIQTGGTEAASLGAGADKGNASRGGSPPPDGSGTNTGEQDSEANGSGWSGALKVGSVTGLAGLFLLSILVFRKFRLG